MRRRIFRRAGVGVIAVVGLAGVGDAQAPVSGKVDAWVVQAHLKMRVSDWRAPDPRGPIQRMLVRTLRHGSVVRTEFLPDPNAGWEGAFGFPTTTALLTTSTDTGVVVMGLDSAQKQVVWLGLSRDFPSDVWSFGNFRDTRDTTDQPSPHDPVMQVRDVSVDVMKVGAGPVVQGHATTRYRQSQRATVLVRYDSLMSTTVIWTASMDVDIATDIPRAPPIDVFGISRAAESPLEIALTHALEPALRAAAAKYPNGVVLHVEGQQLNGSLLGTVTRLFEIDVDSWKQEQVDASLFVVPTGYKRGFSMYFR